MKRKIKIIPLHIYKRGVCVFLGTKKQFREYIKKEALEIDLENDEDFEEGTIGMTFRLSLDALIYLYPTANEGVVVHELGHATKHILHIIDVNDEEAEMYLLEYLYNEVMPWFRAVCSSEENQSFSKR